MSMDVSEFATIPHVERVEGLAVHEVDRLLHRLHRRWERRAHTFWLASGGDDRRLGRYSYLGTDPYLVVEGTGTEMRLTWCREGRVERLSGDPFQLLSRLTASLFQRSLPADGPPFRGGAVGYFAYDLCELTAPVRLSARRDLDVPDLYVGFYDAVCCVDHVEGTAWLMSDGRTEESGAAEAQAEERLAWLRGEVEAALREGDDAEAIPAARAPLPRREGERIPSNVRSTFDRQGYRAMVERAQEYIAAGEIDQVNLSQRFSVPTTLSPGALFRTMLRVNPVPFAALLQPGPFAVVSASPERFLRISGGRVETRPIKGTRPRGADPAADARWRNDLLTSPKDLAEHAMIVEVEREDLGRFCRPGSVRVTESLRCETYRNVFHLVSTVEGELLPDSDRIECIRSAFPGGSITGAPKVRAIEIIDELEPVRRGVYTGAIGYLGVGGEIDLNVAIRTVILAGGEAHFHVGGGIVAASDPDAEYEETLDKAEGLIAALAEEAVR